MKKLVVLLPFILLASCQSFNKAISSVKTPEIENEASISNYLKENDLDGYKGYAIKDLNSWNEVLSSTRVPNLFFFSKGGVFLNPENDKSCLNDVASFVETIDTINIQNNDNNKDLSYFIEHSRTLSGEEFNVSTDKKYYAVFLWAKFGGKNIIKKMKYWEEVLNDSGISFEIILLNFDEQEFWHK